MAEYAQTYGHPPRPTDSWALFISLTRKASQFWSRRQLILFDAVGDAVSSLFGDGQDGQRIRDELEGMAYPVARKTRRPAVIENTWAKDPPEEGSDG